MDARLSALVAALEPPALPRPQLLAFDGSCATGSPGSRVGGDWYDAFVRRDGTWAFSIGDVAGRGAVAAIPMGNLRSALYAYESVCVYPVTTSHYLDSFLERSYPELIATAFVARYDPATRVLSYANAGHPAPFVRTRAGRLRRLAGTDVPLGAGGLRARSLYFDELERGDTLIAFTDGLSECVRDIGEGERRIERAVASANFAAATRPAHWLLRTLVTQRPHDDVAVLTVRVAR